MPAIKKLAARQILDSRGNPTVECACILTNGQAVTASVPSGASTGTHEAVELRDHDPANYQGKSVGRAVDNINTTLSDIASGGNPTDQVKLDQAFIKADGTDNKSRLGANAILAASLSIAKTAALSQNIPLYKHIAILAANRSPLHIPVPIFNIVNGGLHAGMNLDFQEFIIVPDPKHIPSYHHQLAACVAVFHQLKDILTREHQPLGVGDEGGFAPALATNRRAVELIGEAVTAVNLTFKEAIDISFDFAANTFFKDGFYILKDRPEPLSTDQYFDFLSELITSFAPLSFEDPFSEDDWDDWIHFTREHGDQVIIIGDDLLVTNPQRLQQAIDQKACNAILVKPNQIGSVTEAINVVLQAQKAGFKTVVSHRSGETNDDFIADFAVGVGADYVKFGAPDRGERIAKFNRLLAIESEITPS